MDKKVATLLNDQIQKEFVSAYIYLDMANYYGEKNLDGFAHWFTKQAEEEMEHGMKIYNYMHDNGIKVTLKPIAAPSKKYKNASEPLAEALKHEQYVTSSIYAIVAAAEKAKDYRTLQFLDWFVAEQAEEEKDAGELIDKMALFGKTPEGLYLFDKDLAARE
ncbi:MAG: ferritin [Lachnospiraceae bacterium]|nr:ferritin [Lachnospiraceae bacterium]